MGTKLGTAPWAWPLCNCPPTSYARCTSVLDEIVQALAETNALVFSVSPRRSLERLDVRSIGRIVKAIAEAKGLDPTKWHPHLSFKLTPNPDGSWTESVLHSFTGRVDGREPTAGLIFDQAGNLYGTTNGGGLMPINCISTNGCGVVFKLTPNSDGSWTESVLHNFTKGADGAHPSTGSLIFDATGNLYGTAEDGANLSCKGGSFSGCGTIFKMTPNSNGSWAFSVLHAFAGNPARNPMA